MSFSLTYCEFTNLLDASKSDSPVALRQAIIGKLMSFDTYVTQNLPSHTAGTASGYLVNSSTHAIGEKSVAVDTGSGTIKEGDIFTVAGGSETYTVTYNSGTGVLNYYPAATSAFANNAAITFTASQAIAGVFFHKSTCAFVSGPMSDVPSLGSNILTLTDPVTQTPLRLEMIRKNKLTYWEPDLLWGMAVVRPKHVLGLIR